jgi:hypothetical protein
MATQYIVNDKGEKTAVIVPINEYENLLHQHQYDLELSDGYKSMINQVMDKEDHEKVRYITFKDVKKQLLQ